MHSLPVAYLPLPRREQAVGPRVALVLGTVQARRIARGLFGALRERSEYLLLDAARSVADIEHRLRHWRPDVLVVHGSTSTESLLRRRRYPVILLGHAASAGAADRIVAIDDGAVGAMAAAYFRARGLRHFAFYGTTQSFGRIRQEGFARELARTGHSAPAFFDPERGASHSLEGGGTSPRFFAWLRRLPRPVGIFVAHDSDGVQLLQACRHLGLAVPHEVSVVGVNDDAIICSVAYPALSSIAIPWFHVGQELARQIEGCTRMGARRAPARGGHAPVLIAPLEVITRASSDALAVQHPRVAAAVRYLIAHLGEALTVPDVARAAGLSRRLLEMAFRRELQRSPLEIIHQARVERAKTLLTDPAAQLADVAERCGFAYPERFSVVFKRVTGQTPAAFRRQFAATQ